jgi:hypothetical protein
VLESDIGVVHRPNDTVDVSTNVEEDRRVGQALDSGLERER